MFDTCIHSKMITTVKLINISMTSPACPLCVVRTLKIYSLGTGGLAHRGSVLFFRGGGGGGAGTDFVSRHSQWLPHISL